MIANRRVPESVQLARFYLAKRHIPANHLIAITTATAEEIDRKTYTTTIQQPVREQLAAIRKRHRIHCLVTMFGVPLKIAGRENERGLSTTAAAVDSELALVLTASYPLKGWLPNPYFLPYQHQKTRLHRDDVLMVSRLDGPGPALIQKMIADSLAAERTGLQGQGCFDARWPLNDPRKQADNYHIFDGVLKETALELQKSGRLPVTLDTTESLLAAGRCPQTALYCGWYSLNTYVDAFTWVRGSIGYHVASGECATLRDPAATAWCPQMLRHGVSATIGPVYEPYLQAFPRPDIFFPKLVEGYLTLGESFLISLPSLSWQVILVGDPLYQPFKPAATHRDQHGLK